MTTRLYTHADCLNHITPDGHPERVARLNAVLDALQQPQFSALERHDAPLGTDEQLLLCHPNAYVESIKRAVPKHGLHQLDGDTYMSPGSYTAALRGVGAICAAIDAVLDGEIQNTFCATRPPGHHAEYQTSMGFCLFGTAAIGARYALEMRNLNRVAVVDFDVHHGNGTQDLLQSEPRAIFASSHQMPLWPGSGDAHEVGAHNNIINIPLPPASTGADLLDIYQNQLFARLVDHQPELLIISAGFDAHEDDPLANLNFTSHEFGKLTQTLCEFAHDYCDGRVVSLLEGGYDLDALAQSAANHVKALMES